MPALKGFISNNEQRNPRVDGSTHALDVVDYPHHEIHAGSMFHLEDSNDDVNVTPLHISFTTGNTPALLHVLPAYDIAGEALFTMTEAPTGGVAGGTATDPVNKRRDSSNTSIVTGPVVGASAPTGGTVLESKNSGAAQGSSRSSGTNRGENEWVLKPNTQYSFRVTSATSGANGWLELNWYEHTDRN